MTDAGNLMAELDDLRRQRANLREHVLGAQLHGRKRRDMIDRLRQLTRRELTIETQLLVKVPQVSAPADGDEAGRELDWWQR